MVDGNLNGGGKFLTWCSWRLHGGGVVAVTLELSLAHAFSD